MIATLEDCPVDTITVDTMIKGPIEVPADKVITLVGPLLGFEHLKRWIIYQTDAGPLYWLQAVEDRRAAFCLIAPFQAGIKVDMDITPADAHDIGAASADQIDVYTVVVLDNDPGQIRTNLAAPILVSARSGLGKQVVLEDPRLPIRFLLKDLGKGGAKAG